MNNKEHKLAIIGGDARQLIAASRLGKMGYETVLFGFGDELGTKNNCAVDSECCSSCFASPDELLGKLSASYAADFGVTAQTAEKAISGADAVILALPACTDGKRISTPLSGASSLTFDEIIADMNKNGVKLLAGGKLPEEWRDLCRESGITVFDYYESEEFAIANAVPTAEGAIEIAMRELPVTVNGCNALVIGYGRIGKVLSRLLDGLGANVTVSARKPQDMAWITAGGYRAVHTEKLLDVLDNGFDVIFNTVPYRVLDGNVLKKLPSGTLIVDLASKPGGVDISEAKRLSLKVVWALSLPGKVAPVTSGEIIADIVGAWLSHEAGGD